MSGSLTFQPFLTTNAQGSFSVTETGFIQGCAMPDPAVRYALASGQLAYTETLPIWGGVGISTAVPTYGVADNIINPGTLGNPSPTLGAQITRATNVTSAAANSLIGFSVFDQAHAWLNTPQSPVPVGSVGQFVPYYRLGSGARIPVAVNPVLASLEGEITTTPVSWDFVNQELIPYNAAYAANVLTAQSWSSTSGGTLTFTTTSAHGVAVGAQFVISGSTPDGYNGTYIAVSGTAGSTLVARQVSNPGASSVLGTLVAGGGALKVQVLDIDIGNSMVVSYDPTTGLTTWNRSGSAALILI